MLAHRIQHARHCRWRTAGRNAVERRNEDASAPLEIWGYDCVRGELAKFADAGRTLDLSMSEWRRLTGNANDGGVPSAAVVLLSSAPGKATIVLHYWNVIDGLFVEDEARQVVTAVNPPLLPDYNRDGAIDAQDVAKWMGGAVFRYWTNKDVWTGDNAFPSPGVLPPSPPPSSSDSVVNGRNDLVNLCPFKADLSAIVSAWGTNDFDYVFYTGGPASTRFALVDAEWGNTRAMVCEDVRTIDGGELHEATLRRNEGTIWSETGCALPGGFLGLADCDSGLIAVEFGQRCISQRLELAVCRKGSTTRRGGSSIRSMTLRRRTTLEGIPLR